MPEYTIECDCRKPKTGLIDQALDSFDIDISRSYVVGDHFTDLELAHNCDLRGIIVKSGYGLGGIKYILPKIAISPSYIANDLLDAVNWILNFA